MKLLCDQMLGTLARWLRLLGFNVYYVDDETTDNDILDVAAEEKRVVISRDKQLVERAKKIGLPVVEVHSTDLDEQLKKIISTYPVKKEMVLSRCSLCNTPLVKVEKTEVKGKVPSKVFAAHNNFWYCKKCDKIYWKGSHWVRIEEKMKELTEKS